MTIKEIIITYRTTGTISKDSMDILRAKWIVNWVWPQKSIWGVNYLIDCITNSLDIDIEASGDMHDLNYYIGWTEEDKQKADRGFFTRLIDDIMKANFNLAKEWFYIILAYIAYVWVRSFGYKHFNYITLNNEK